MTSQNKPRKIIITTPVLLLGGTEIQVLSMIKALSPDKYKISICCYYEYDDAMVERFKSVCENVILLQLERKNGLFHLFLKLFFMFHQFKPDIVHVQYLAPGLIPIFAAHLARVPVIFSTIHIAGSIVYGRKAKILLRLAAHFCTRFICVSRGVEEFWFGDSEIFDPANLNNARKHFTVYNAIDTVAIANAVSAVDKHRMKKMLGIAERPVIGIVGRLAHQKGHTILLDAMAEIIKEFPDAVLMIIGEGPERKNLGEKALALNINKNILWLGVQPQNKVFEFYAIIDIFAMPSLYEGFGLTATEAMAAGVPVVGAKVEGLSEVIEDGVTGYLVPAGNSGTFGEAVIKLLKDIPKAKAMGQNGCKRAEKLFSLEHFSNSMKGIYRTF
jgi:glycosyltransferase involved in cell wall biosynthesis